MGTILRITTDHAVRFVSVGFLNTAFGYTTFAALVYFGAPNLAALLLATIFGVAFNYFSYGSVFKNTDSGLSVFGRFVFAYGFVYLFNAIFLDLLAVRFGLNPYLSQLICMFPSVALNWFILRKLVFRRSGYDAE